jgi:hypothetical protein
MIDTFEDVDTRFAQVTGDDAVSVRSTRSNRSNFITVSPGRYSLGRFLEDQNSARTINPNHTYYETNNYVEDPKQKTFGNLKAAPRASETVTTKVTK